MEMSISKTIFSFIKKKTLGNEVEKMQCHEYFIDEQIVPLLRLKKLRVIIVMNYDYDRYTLI